MAKATKTTTTKPARKAVKSFTVELSTPGNLPEVFKVKTGATIASVLEGRSTEGLVITRNGSSAELGDELFAGDKLRLGLKTKNQ